VFTDLDNRSIPEPSANKKLLVEPVFSFCLVLSMSCILNRYYPNAYSSNQILFLLDIESFLHLYKTESKYFQSLIEAAKIS